MMDLRHRSNSNSPQSEVLRASSIGARSHANTNHKRKLISTTPEPHSSNRKAVKTSEDESICSRCREIDFHRVLEDPFTSEEPITLATFEVQISSTENCALCHMLRETAPVKQHRTTFVLRAYPVLRYSSKIEWSSCPGYLKSRDQSFLAVCSTRHGDADIKHVEEVGQLYCRRTGVADTRLFKPQIVPPKVDYARVQHWLEYCQRHHSYGCRRTKRKTQLEDMKVIDCIDQVIVTAPSSCNYIALSYVWGHQRSSEDVGKSVSAGLLPSCLPQTVSDAMIVTRKLGYRYLWVDRFCIDQMDEDMKHAQIRQMDGVYHNAEITLVAAVGTDENSGLVGVSNRSRKPQLTARLDDLELICTGPHPHWAIKQSKWSSRGWTFQEAVLSRRRLVFTEHQLYFECNAMNCCEALQVDLDLLHTKNKQKSLKCLYNGVLAGNDGVPFGPTNASNLSQLSNLGRYRQLIMDYTKRDLTFDDDAFNAFAGIATDIARSKYPFVHMCGLPIPDPNGWPTWGTEIAFTLLWRHTACEESFSSPPRRRYHFPSWSWTGWAGPIEFAPIKKKSFSSKVSDVILEARTGNLFVRARDLPQLVRVNSNLRSGLPRGIILSTAIVAPALITRSNRWKSSVVDSDFQGIYVADLPARLYLSQRKNSDVVFDSFQKGEWKLILMGDEYVPRSEFSPVYFLIIEENTGFATRVGMLRVLSDNLKIFERFEQQRIRLL